MRIRITNSKDFYSGLLFIFFGLTAMVVGCGYPIGALRHMGPGYFPSIVGGILSLLGFAILIRGLCTKGEPIKIKGLRVLFLILGSVISFAIMIDSLGLVLGILALILISSFAIGEFRILETVFLYLLLLALTIGTFVYGLGLPFKVLP